MIYMLDTNICVYTIKKNPPKVFETLRKLSPGSVGISAVTEAALRFGMSNSSRPEHNQRILDQFLAPLQIVPFDSAAAAHYGDIRLHLKREGTPIGNMDLLIAAHARSLSVTLVTHNIKEFERVPGLNVENWA
jgi:tRNA(fMet)-specific endonuclease VapC